MGQKNKFPKNVQQGWISLFKLLSDTLFPHSKTVSVNGE